MSAAHLRAVLGDYAHTRAVRGPERPDALAGVEFIDVSPAHKAFAPMVRDQAYDLSEMAIVTYLQALAHGKPLVLLPAVLVARFQHHCLVHNVDRGALSARDLEGRRIGVRSYSQTTGVWVRGILATEYDVDLAAVEWVTYEDAHVAEYDDPDGVVRAPAGSTPAAMLQDGALDAAILGRDLPDDPRLQPVIGDPAEAARAWYVRTGVRPINHMVVATRQLVEEQPDVVVAYYRALAEAKAASASESDVDLLPFGVGANRPSLDLISDFAWQQGLTDRRISVDEMFAGLPDEIAAETSPTTPPQSEGALR